MILNNPLMRSGIRDILIAAHRLRASTGCRLHHASASTPIIHFNAHVGLGSLWARGRLIVVQSAPTLV